MNTQANIPQPPDRRWRDRALLLTLLAAVVIGLGAMAAATGWRETMAQVSKLSWLEFFSLLGLSLINYGFRSLRWHIFVRRLGISTSLTQNFRHFLGGFAMTVTPGRIGELIRMRWLRRETGWSFERTAPLVLVDRASDLAAMAIILAISVGLTRSGISGAAPIALLALTAAFVATRPSLLIWLADTTYRMVGRYPRLFARARRAAKSLSRFSNPWMMGTAAIIGAIGWFAEAYGFYMLLSWMGADIRLPMAIAIFIFSALAGGLTGAPGGVGGAEAAMVLLLSYEGVPLETSLAATAIIRITTLWFAILIGLVVFPFAESHSKKVQDALENH